MWLFCKGFRETNATDFPLVAQEKIGPEFLRSGDKLPRNLLVLQILSLVVAVFQTYQQYVNIEMV